MTVCSYCGTGYDLRDGGHVRYGGIGHLPWLCRDVLRAKLAEQEGEANAAGIDAGRWRGLYEAAQAQLDTAESPRQTAGAGGGNPQAPRRDARSRGGCVVSRDHLITCAAYTDTAKPCDGGCALLPGARHPCDYCGTMLDEDGCVESGVAAVNGPTLHSATQCREYVHAVMVSYKRDAARFRQALADAAEALWLAGQGAPMASAKLAAELAHKVLPEGGYPEASGCPYCGRRPDEAR